MKGVLQITGKDLIIYILKNDLENENIEYILTQTFLTKERVAIRLGVGVETVKTMAQLDLLPSIMINGELYIFNDYEKKKTTC